MINTFQRATQLFGIFAVMCIYSWSAVAQEPQHGPLVKRIVGLDYPWFGRIGGIQGTVVLVASVAPDGTVRNVRTATGPEPLAKPAAAVLSKWLFEAGCSATSAGCDARVTFVFTLSGVCDISQQCPTDFVVDLPNVVKLTAKHAHAIVN